MSRETKVNIAGIVAILTTLSGAIWYFHQSAIKLIETHMLVHAERIEQINTRMINVEHYVSMINDLRVSVRESIASQKERLRILERQVFDLDN